MKQLSHKPNDKQLRLKSLFADHLVLVGCLYFQPIQGYIFLNYLVQVRSIYFQTVQGFIFLNYLVLVRSIYFHPVKDNLKNKTLN